jgi:polyisoprenoid-binding protein YceI
VGIKKLSSKSERDLPQFELDGQFTLQATTRPLTVIVDVQEQDHWQRVRGTLSILQTDFGIKPYTKAFGAIGVADKLEILGDIWVAKAELTTEP